VEDRCAALEAIRNGFYSLDLPKQLEHFSAMELATLFFGKQYLDVDALVNALSLKGNDAAGTHEPGWTALSGCYQKTASRWFWHVSSTMSPYLGQDGPSLFSCIQQQSSPGFPGGSHMQLPNCASIKAFVSRMGVALHLGEYMTKTGGQDEQRLTRVEEIAIVAAMEGEIWADGHRVYLWVYLCSGEVWGSNAESALS